MKNFFKNAFSKFKNMRPLFAIILTVILIVFICTLWDILWQINKYGIDHIIWYYIERPLTPNEHQVKQTHWLLLFFVIFFGGILIFRYIVPTVIFVLERILYYISLAIFCLTHKLKIKLGRFPLASLFGMSEKADIIIETENETFYIHFVDIVFRFRSVFTLINDKKYNFSKAAIMKVNLISARQTHPDLNKSFNFTDGTDKKFPEFPALTDTSAKHIILAHPEPLGTRFIEDNAIRELYSGYSVGNITYFSKKGLKKCLKKSKFY